MSPTQRSLAELRKRGYYAEVVERWNPYSRTRHDFANLFDILCFTKNAPGVLGVQATSTANVRARIKKMQANPLLAEWIAAGNEAFVMGWSKKGPRGKRKLWTLDERPVVP